MSLLPAAPSRPHTDALEAALTGVGVLVGRGGRPDDGGWQGEPGRTAFTAYAVLYPGAGIPDGDLADPSEYLDYRCQVTCVAATSEGAEAVADKVKTLVGRRLTVAGRSSYPVWLTLDRPASRDDSVAPPVHYLVLELAFRTGPAPA
ncbi:hypothetical protein [Actinoallomurus sp. CA-142502]|uniref:hypothetical protein n=1 Tax=Actinoallomurus sp. CA-142502 TaxID=3239885 RepID=UPI003D8E51AB